MIKDNLSYYLSQPLVAQSLKTVVHSPPKAQRHSRLFKPQLASRLDPLPHPMLSNSQHSKVLLKSIPRQIKDRQWLPLVSRARILDHKGRLSSGEFLLLPGLKTSSLVHRCSQQLLGRNLPTCLPSQRHLPLLLPNQDNRLLHQQLLSLACSRDLQAHNSSSKVLLDSRNSSSLEARSVLACNSSSNKVRDHGSCLEHQRKFQTSQVLHKLVSSSCRDHLKTCR